MELRTFGCVSVACIAIWVLVTACGGRASSVSSAPSRGNGGGSGGAASVGGAAAQGGTFAESGAGDAEPDAGDAGAHGGQVATGEYWIDSTSPCGAAGECSRGYTCVNDVCVRREPIHVRVISSTEARVWTQSDGEQLFSIERAPGAALSVGPVPTATSVFDSGPAPALHGPLVLRNVAEDLSSYAERIHAIAVSESEAGRFGSDAIVLERRLRCGAVEWETPTTNVKIDLGPTTVSVVSAGHGVPFVPWTQFSLSLSKPLAEPSWQAVHALADGIQLEIAWDNLARTGASGHFPSWLSLLGKTIEFSGELPSTNGVASPVPAGLAVRAMNFGPVREGSIDFTTKIPDDLEHWGSELLAPNANAMCPRGCLRLTSYGGLALRLPATLTSIAIRYRASQYWPQVQWPVPPSAPLTVNAKRLGGSAQITVLQETPNDFVDGIVSVPAAPGDVFLALDVPIGIFNAYGPTWPGCESQERWVVYIESITVSTTT